MKKATPDFSKALHRHGLKATSSRLDVLKALAWTGRPINIQTILGVLPKRFNKVTAYRVLADLKKAGLVRQIDFQQPHAFFELADPKDHHHLVCLSCDRIESFTGCEAGRLSKKALRKSKRFAAVTGHSFELFGVCKACQT